MVNYRKLTKPTARKAFNNDDEVYLLPCKVSGAALLGRYWVKPVVIKRGVSTPDFDTAVNAFEYYNCNSELGHYAHYYIKVKEREVKENEAKT